MASGSENIEDIITNYLYNQGISRYETKTTVNTDKTSHCMSNIKYISVEGKNKNNEEVKLFLILKVAPFHIRKICAIREIFHNENFIYEYVLPEFEKFQKDRNIVNKFKSYANFCVSSMEHLREVIVLENMTSKGFKLYNHNALFDYDHTSLLIKELGRLHALSFAIRDQKPDLFKNFMETITEAEFDELISPANKEIIENILSECLDTLDPVKNSNVLQKFKDIEHLFYEKAVLCLKKGSKDDQAVITHSDLWVSNSLFKYNEIGQPSEVCLIDWQLTKIFSPASDIFQLLFMCVDKQMRDKYYKEFINEYYNSFSSFLRELGSDPDLLFPFGALERHFKKYSLPGLYVTIRTISFTSIVKESMSNFEGKDIATIMCSSKRDPKLFNERMRDVFLDYVAYGYEL